jgi:hypothetical protein
MQAGTARSSGAEDLQAALGRAGGQDRKHPCLLARNCSTAEQIAPAILLVV